MTPMRGPSFSQASPGTASSARATPFDYAFRYELTGIRNTVINQTITISIESTFTAVSIGYGVVPKVTPIVFGPTPPQDSDDPRDFLSISFDQVLTGLSANLEETFRTLPGETGPEAVFRNGIKLNPDVAEFALQGVRLLRGNDVPDNVRERLFQVVGSPSEQVQFKYALFDEGSGREFQNEPILNIAGLGSADGERPFRYFATPIVFPPRTTIRMEVTELSEFKGTLHVSLHGYKVLGAGNAPTGAARRTRRRR